MQHHSTGPDCYAVCFAYQGLDTRSVKPGDVLAVDRVLIGDIIHAEVNKSKGGVGNFSLLLGSSKNWKALLPKGSWIFIYMSPEQMGRTESTELNSGIKCVGIIKSVRRVRQKNRNGVQTIRYRISGEDFHSILNRPVYQNLNIAQSFGGGPLMIANVLFSGDPDLQFPIKPHKVTRLLLNHMLGGSGGVISVDPQTNKVSTSPDAIQRTSSNFSVKVPPAVYRTIYGSDFKIPNNHYASMLARFLQTDLVGWLTNPPSISDQISPWSAIQAYCNSILNEVYTDLLPININGKVILAPSIVLRAIPFSSETGSPHHSCLGFLDAAKLSIAVNHGTIGLNLATKSASHFYVSKHIHEDDIILEDIGNSDAERFNFFLIPLNLVVWNNVGGELAVVQPALADPKNYKTIADSTSIARYGSCPYITSTQYANEKSDGDDLTLTTRIANDLWNRAHLYDNGVITLRGAKEYIPVGTNAIFSSRNQMGHIERVSHQFQVDRDGKKSMRTSIYLSRIQMLDGGAPDDIEFTDTPESGQYPIDRGYGKTSLK